MKLFQLTINNLIFSLLYISYQFSFELIYEAILIKV